MFIVTGASGTLGRKIIENLLLRVPAASIGISVRDPAKVADFEAKGGRVRQGATGTRRVCGMPGTVLSVFCLSPPTRLQRGATRSRIMLPP